MDMPRNTFRDALRAGQNQIGLWVGLADANVAELLAGCGFDWLLLDGEHAPNNVRTLLEQLRAVAPYPVHPIVRVVEGSTARIKQLLDIGAQTLMVPMVETPEQARELVAAMRYPPEGIRGMGTALARASRWNQIREYGAQANGQMALIVQVESIGAVGRLDAIARVPGVDGVFFGPADLSASMGLSGQLAHPEVHRTILEGIRTVRAAGKAAGVLTTDDALAREYLGAGAQFMAVGLDATLLGRAARELRQRF